MTQSVLLGADRPATAGRTVPVARLVGWALFWLAIANWPFWWITLGDLGGVFGERGRVGVVLALLGTGYSLGARRLAAWRIPAVLTAVAAVIVAVIGSTILLFGLALIVLPEPAVVVVPLGLAILATEFAWARRLVRRGGVFFHKARRWQRQRRTARVVDSLGHDQT